MPVTATQVKEAEYVLNRFCNDYGTARVMVKHWRDLRPKNGGKGFPRPLWAVEDGYSTDWPVVQASNGRYIYTAHKSKVAFEAYLDSSGIVFEQEYEVVCLTAPGSPVSHPGNCVVDVHFHSMQHREVVPIRNLSNDYANLSKLATAVKYYKPHIEFYFGEAVRAAAKWAAANGYPAPAYWAQHSLSTGAATATGAVVVVNSNSAGMGWTRITGTDNVELVSALRLGVVVLANPNLKKSKAGLGSNGVAKKGWMNRTSP